MREDLRSTLLAGQNAQRRAIESLQPDEVLVIEARGETDAGTIGDIFAMPGDRSSAPPASSPTVRCATRRRSAGSTSPCTTGASHAATFGRCTCPLDHQVPIACAGVTVMPGDVIVGDERGRRSSCPRRSSRRWPPTPYQQELEEEWALERRRRRREHDRRVPDRRHERRAEFEAWLAKREETGGVT